MRRALFVATALALVLVNLSVDAAPKQITVSFLTGKAVLARGSATKPLAVGAAVRQGDKLTTEDKSRLELSLPDGSKLRLAEKTSVTLSEAHFGADRSRKLGVTTWVGNVWAHVAKALSDDDRFEVSTKNAVAGVRGTTFAIHAASDLSAVVRVYAGTVGVRKGEGETGFATTKQRKQVPGPAQIDRKQWEEIIATSMKQVKVTALGELSPAEDFIDSGADLEWAEWNRARDQ